MLLSRANPFSITFKNNKLTFSLTEANIYKPLFSPHPYQFTRSMVTPILSRLQNLCNDNPFFLYAVAWTSMVTITVAMAAFAPEVAFVWAVSPSSPLTRACWGQMVGLPMDGPVWEKVCLPGENFSQSKADVFIPPVFAVLVVVGSISVMKAIGLWEGEEEEEDYY